MVEPKKMETENSKTYKRAAIISALFGVTLVAFEFIVLPNSRISLQILVRHFESNDYLRFLAILFFTLSAFGIFLAFVYAALLSSVVFRVIYFLLFSFLIITQYGYYKAFEAFPRFQEVEVALFSPNWEIFSNAVWSYFSFLALIPIVVFGILILVTPKVFDRSWPALAALVIAFGGFYFGTTYFTKNTFYVHSFNNGLRTIISVPVIWELGTINDTAKSDHYNMSRDRIGYVSNEKPKNNIVFIVDESIRADHLSLNGYPKATTPTLERLNKNGLLKNYGVAVSGTTCSVTSNGLLLTGLNNLPDEDFKIYRLPTIFQYAKAMNYKTFYFDGQVSSLWNGKSTDVENYGTWIKSKELNQNLEHKYDVDAEIARRIKKIVNNSTGNFLWITKYGVHQSYIDSYPNASGSKEERYDQAVRFNSESFFGELSKDPNFGKDTIFIYTSDHGRALNENGSTATHCSNSKPEANVPLLLLSSADNLPDVDVSFSASHANLFATILDLMNFPPEKRKFDYSISLLKAKAEDSQPRNYFVGDIHNQDEGKKYAFDD